MLRLGRYRALHTLVAALHVLPIAGVVLRRFPLHRRLNPSGIVYRVTSLDQLSLASGLFERKEYAPAVDGLSITTLIDLGCNAGWFTLWLKSVRPDTQLRGLLIDAHPRMAAEANWHLKQNGLTECIVVHAAVGLPPGQSSITFHLHPSTSASSVLSYQPGKQLPVKGEITDVVVPAVSVGSQWQDHFGDTPVDLMKVDIEGMELDLVVNEGEFLQKRVRSMVVEWHKWCVSRQELDTQLASIGFGLREIFEETDLAGLALYQNSKDLG
jgi:FkbM family methyltransferase